MQETDTRTLEELVINLHDVARELEKKAPLTAKVEAFELRKVAERITRLSNSERYL